MSRAAEGVGAGAKAAPAPAAVVSGRAVRRLDLVERVVLVGFYLALIVRLQPQHVLDWLVLASEGVVLLFALVRRSTDQISHRPSEWALAFAGSALPLLITAGGVGTAPLAPAQASLWLMMFGLTLNIGAKLSLRRSFGMVPANRGVKDWGLYRVVRHPMYLGYLIAHVGWFLAHPTWRNGVLYGLTLACQIARIGAEEKLLGEDPAYRTYAGKVKWRLVPLVW
jgi:protein-S-isoprenylcysteine O-methyltransferase Ste14